MILSFQRLVLIFISCLMLQACETKASPKTIAEPSPLLPDKSRQFGNISLSLTDTNSAEWRGIVHKLDSFYARQVKNGFSGAVLLGYKGQILYERYFGYSNRSLKIKFGPNSSSQLASTSKTFTAAAVLFLHQHNYLDIDDLVSEYIPGFPYEDVTIKMLLNHRSGISDYTKWAGSYFKSRTEFMTNDNVVEYMIKYKPRQDFKTDTRFKYSNSNYSLLATIIEKATDMKYPKFMKTYFFDPLGMKNTFVFNPETGLPANAALNYKGGGPYHNMYLDGVYGDKEIYSTTRDMYKWDQSFYNNALLNDSSLKMAYAPYSFEKPGIKNYGLGWRMLNYKDGCQIVYHNGWWHGNNTCFYRFIQDNFTIIVLGNNYSQSIYRQPKVIYSIVKQVDSLEDFDIETEE